MCSVFLFLYSIANSRMSSSYFGNVAAAAASGWGATTATAVPHHHHLTNQDHHQFYKYGYSESPQYYGHHNQYQHHHQSVAMASNPTTATPSPPSFRYAGSSVHGAYHPQSVPAATAPVSFQCSTTLAPVAKHASLEASSCTSPTSSSSSHLSASPSLSSASPASVHDHQRCDATVGALAGGGLYGMAQHQIDSFHSQRHGGTQNVHQQNQLTATNGSMGGPSVVNPLLETSSSTCANNNSISPYVELHHRSFQNNNSLQQQQHHAMVQTHANSYCIKNPNASSYFPGSWMQAYAGMHVFVFVLFQMKIKQFDEKKTNQQRSNFCFISFRFGPTVQIKREEDKAYTNHKRMQVTWSIQRVGCVMHVPSSR